MNYYVNGVNNITNKTEFKKYSRSCHTSNKKHYTNEINNHSNNVDEIGFSLLKNNDRRSDQFHLDPSSWKLGDEKDHNFDSTDTEIVKYISEILNIISKPLEGRKNSETHKQVCCSFKPGDKNLNRLLSLRLGQLTSIKDLCVNNKIDSKSKPSKINTIEIPKGHYYVKKPVLNISEAKFDLPLLETCLKSLRWKSCNYNAGDVYWLGMSISLPQMIDFISSNKCVNYPRIVINRFPNLYEITRKGYFYHILDTYTIYMNNSRDYFPKSFKLPEDLGKVLSSLEKNTPLIFKPSNGSMGQGVKVVTTSDHISEELLIDYTAQEYISSPLLLDGKKFDIRVYLLLVDTGILRGFISKHSLVRVCTEDYEYPSISNTNNNFIHLTNYSINKYNTVNYHRGEDINDKRNNKRPLESVLNSLEEIGYNKDEIWLQIVNISSVVSRTIYPELYFNTKLMTNSRNIKILKKIPNFFQILGLDVIIDIYGKVRLLEVNCCPSLKTNYFDGKYFKEDPVDQSIKVPLITEALILVNLLQSNQLDLKSEEKLNNWDELEITTSQPLENLIKLFKIAKNGSWKRVTLSKKEWLTFCKVSNLTELAALIHIIRNGDNKEEIRIGGSGEDGIFEKYKQGFLEGKSMKKINYNNGNIILSEMYCKLLGRKGKEITEGLCFSNFVIILGLFSNIVEKCIKTIEKETILDICSRNNFSIHINLFITNDKQPHNLFNQSKIYITPEFLKFLNYHINLDY